MTAVLISIQPKWCELIASGKKTVEVRKTRPKLTTPFKVYIYCTGSGKDIFFRSVYSYDDVLYTAKHKEDAKRRLSDNGHLVYNGKVIGEFVCNCMVALKADNMVQVYYNNTKDTCLTDEEIKRYANGKKLYYWHISDLVIYDKPKELSEFRTPCKMTEGSCYFCDYAVHGMDGDLIDCNTSLTRPPQSWCYVEERSNR